MKWQTMFCECTVRKGKKIGHRSTLMDPVGPLVKDFPGEIPLRTEPWRESHSLETAKVGANPSFCWGGKIHRKNICPQINVLPMIVLGKKITQVSLLQLFGILKLFKNFHRNLKVPKSWEILEILKSKANDSRSVQPRPSGPVTIGPYHSMSCNKQHV